MRSNKPYVPLDPALIEQARQIDLLTYLRDCEPRERTTKEKIYSLCRGYISQKKS